MKRSLRNFIMILSVVTLGAMIVLPGQTRSMSSDVYEAQSIMTQFGIPTGPTDGLWGKQTARGICAFRSIAGLPVNRKAINGKDMVALRNFKSQYTSIEQIAAPPRDGSGTYLVADKTCQVMIYVEGGRYAKVMAISTGKSGSDTRVGSFPLGGTQRGWHCSGSYPETCATQTAGRFTPMSDFGNMYNIRHVYGGVYVHGSTSVPPYPASHGCIRVTTADSDWMFDRVGNNGRPTLHIVGQY